MDSASPAFVYPEGRLEQAAAVHARLLEFYELPKTMSGKIRRVELRGRERDLSQGPVAPGEWRDEDFGELKG